MNPQRFIKPGLVFCMLINTVITGCHSNNLNNATCDSIIYTKHVSETRLSVSLSAVKVYNEVVKSFETIDTFKVYLYETNQTFKYLIKINYKQLNAEDTLRIPNFGINPEIEIRKGNKRPSCIIGFLDNRRQFRESKMVSFENSEIKVHVLKHYAVATYQDTIK